MSKIDMTGKDFDWDQIPGELRKLLQHMEDSIPTEATEEEFVKYEEAHPITLGFGDYVLVIPQCAASYNFLQYCLEDMAKEFEA